MKNIKAQAILENMRNEGIQKRNKWKPVVEAVNAVYRDQGLSKMDEWKEITMTNVLETHSVRTSMMSAYTASESFTGTQPANTSFIMKHGINVLASAMSGLIAHDLVSVQALQARVGEIRYLDVKYGDDKGRFKRGDTMFAHDRLGGPRGEFDYTSSEVLNEALIVDDVNAKLDWLPVDPGSVKMVVGSVAVTDNGEGKLMNGAAEFATIDYASGKIVFAQAPAEIPLVDYMYDNITAPVQAPELILDIKQIPVMATSRKLKTVIAFDAMYDLQTQFGFDAASESSTLVSNYLQYEIDGEIIDELMANANAPAVTFSKKVPNAVSLLDHYEGFQSSIIEASNNIFDTTRFAHGNWAVLGSTASTIVESLAARGGFTSSGQTAQGPHFLGTLGNFSMYKTPLTADRNSFLVGHKGDNMFYAGYVYAPYLPILSTDMLAYENFSIAQGFSTSYAKKLVNSNLYSKGKITQ